MAEYDPLSSISWQLKRIAEALESIDQRQRNQERDKMAKEERAMWESSKLRKINHS